MPSFDLRSAPLRELNRALHALRPDTNETHWTVTGPDVAAVLTPFHRRVASTQAGVIAAKTHQAFGRWSGWARGGKGVEQRLDGLVGWAEQAHNRW